VHDLEVIGCIDAPWDKIAHLGNAAVSQR